MSTTTAGAFGTKVEEYMARLGMQQNELAKKVGLSPSHLSRIVNGTRKPPRVGKVRRMIKALRLTEDEADDFCDRAGLSLLILQKNSSKEKEGMKGDIRSKDAGGKEPGGGQPAIAGAEAFGAGVDLDAILPRFRVDQQQTETALQQYCQDIGLLVKQIVAEAQLPPEKMMLAGRLIEEHVRAVCHVLATEQDR